MTRLLLQDPSIYNSTSDRGFGVNCFTAEERDNICGAQKGDIVLIRSVEVRPSEAVDSLCAYTSKFRLYIRSTRNLTKRWAYAGQDGHGAGHYLAPRAALSPQQAKLRGRHSSRPQPSWRTASSLVIGGAPFKNNKRRNNKETVKLSTT